MRFCQIPIPGGPERFLERFQFCRIGRLSGVLDPLAVDRCDSFDQLGSGLAGQAVESVLIALGESVAALIKEAGAVGHADALGVFEMTHQVGVINLAA